MNTSSFVRLSNNYQALSSMPGTSNLPTIESTEVGVLHALREPVPFNSAGSQPPASWTGVDAEAALTMIVSSDRVQDATGLDRQGLLRRLADQWSADSALRECEIFVSCFMYHRLI